MELIERIQKEYIQAMKEKDEVKASVLNMIKSQIKYKEIELKGSGKKLQESDLIEIIRKEIKKREEAIEMYLQGEREDLLEKEKKELEILKQYLPELPQIGEIEKEIEKIIEEVGAKDKKDFGKVMKLAMEKYRGIIEGELIKEIVQKKLN